MTDRPHDWHRLSPRMLLVHPVHEMLRQLPVLIGSVVLGSATGNPVWPLAALGVTVVFGVLRWFFTTYRIDDENVSLRTGILSRRAVSVPRNRIRSVQTEARLLHRLLGLTVLRVGTGQEARGEAAFELDAVDSARVPRLRALLLAESLAPVEPTGRVLARWQSSWLRYAPLSFSGLVMIGAVIGLGYQTGLAVRLPESGFARSAVDAAQRAGVVLVVAVTVLLVVGVSALLAVLFSWLTYGNLLLRRGGSGQEGVLHLRHGLLRVREHTYDMRRLRGATLREPLLVRLLRGARLDAVMTGVHGEGQSSMPTDHARAAPCRCRPRSPDRSGCSSRAPRRRRRPPWRCRKPRPDDRERRPPPRQQGFRPQSAAARVRCQVVSPAYRITVATRMVAWTPAAITPSQLPGRSLR